MTQGRLRELFDYDQETGDLIRKIRVSNCKKGQPGTIIRTMDSNGYYQVMVDGWVEMAHRVIWCWWYGYVPENQIDHIDGCKTNNSIPNLREVSQSCNIRNQGVRATNKSGITGVRWVEQEGKYQVMIRCPNARKPRTIFRTFNDLTEAVAHRLAAEQCLDYPNCNSSSSAFLYMQRYLKGEL